MAGGSERYTGRLDSLTAVHTQRPTRIANLVGDKTIPRAATWPDRLCIHPMIKTFGRQESFQRFQCFAIKLSTVKSRGLRRRRREPDICCAATSKAGGSLAGNVWRVCLNSKSERLPKCIAVDYFDNAGKRRGHRHNSMTLFCLSTYISHCTSCLLHLAIVHVFRSKILFNNYS